MARSGVTTSNYDNQSHQAGPLHRLTGPTTDQHFPLTLTNISTFITS